MLKITDNEFPHPILCHGKDDYTSGSFSITLVRHQTIGDNFIFTFRYDLEDCPGLQEMIDQKEAIIALRLISISSSFREEHAFIYSNELEIKINKFNIAKTLAVVGYIFSVENDYLFSLNEHNPEYFSNLTFLLRKGDILAITDELKIPLDDSEFKKPVSSIFNIIKGKELSSSEPIFIDYESDIIQIYLCPEIYEYYYLMKKAQRQKEANVAIVYPVLVELLCRMSVDSSNFSEKIWWRVIVNKYEEIYSKGLHDEDFLAVPVANKLLGFIIEDSLSYFAENEPFGIDTGED